MLSAESPTCSKYVQDKDTRCARCARNARNASCKMRQEMMPGPQLTKGGHLLPGNMLPGEGASTFLLGNATMLGN
eukprot:1185774-Prorocentrum_minimum.AAC.4